jgi:DUF4097 and DUF4098 domain-containing protein YvlB
MRLILAAALLLPSSLVLANDCRFSAERNLEIDPAALRALRFELGSSDLAVQGVAGLARIEVKGKACASDQSWLSELNVEQSRQGDKVVVKTSPHTAHTGISGNHYAYIDFTVRIPANLALEVDSGSGDSDLSNIASLDFSSGSGDLKLDRVAGAVSVKVGSGDVIASGVGNFTVGGSGSGDMQVSAVNGDVKVAHVGSGDLQFNDVHGSVQVDSIGSGDLSAGQIGGDVVVGSIGSGDIDAKGVKGNLVVRSAGSGEIHHSGIAGAVDIPQRHAND